MICSTLVKTTARTSLALPALLGAADIYLQSLALILTLHCALW
jgi:hypothetical protein